MRCLIQWCSRGEMHFREDMAMRRYIYGFDHAEEYEEIAPCKFCGGRPYANIAGISCGDCGYEVSRAGRTNGEVVTEWNSTPADGSPRARFACDVHVEDDGDGTEHGEVPPLSPQEVADNLTLQLTCMRKAGAGIASATRMAALEAAVGYARRWVSLKVVRDGDWSPATCPACGEELSSHVGDGVYEDREWLAYCPNDECHQRLDWGA